MPDAVPPPPPGPAPATAPVGSDAVAVAAGGALGALGRHVLGLLLPASPVAAGVVVANLLGSLLIGVAGGRAARRGGAAGGRGALFWQTGVLGGFTTFSGMAVEVLDLPAAGAIAYLAVVVGGGVGLAAAGAALTRSAAGPGGAGEGGAGG